MTVDFQTRRKIASKQPRERPPSPPSPLPFSLHYPPPPLPTSISPFESPSPLSLLSLSTREGRGRLLALLTTTVSLHNFRATKFRELFLFALE